MKKTTNAFRLIAVVLVAAGAGLNVLRNVRGYAREVAQDKAASAAGATKGGEQ